MRKKNIYKENTNEKIHREKKKSEERERERLKVFFFAFLFIILQYSQYSTAPTKASQEYCVYERSNTIMKINNWYLGQRAVRLRIIYDSEPSKKKKKTTKKAKI